MGNDRVLEFDFILPDAPLVASEEVLLKPSAFFSLYFIAHIDIPTVKLFNVDKLSNVVMLFKQSPEVMGHVVSIHRFLQNLHGRHKIVNQGSQLTQINFHLDFLRTMVIIDVWFSLLEYRHSMPEKAGSSVLQPAEWGLSDFNRRTSVHPIFCTKGTGTKGTIRHLSVNTFKIESSPAYVYRGKDVYPLSIG